MSMQLSRRVMMILHMLAETLLSSSGASDPAGFPRFLHCQLLHEMSASYFFVLVTAKLERPILA